MSRIRELSAVEEARRLAFVLRDEVSLPKRFGSAVGAPASLTARCAARQARHLRGMRAAREMFERRVA
ncbi:MAG: hypothetical protein ACQEUM_18120 [Pseudomonadota bacterium]